MLSQVDWISFSVAIVPASTPLFWTTLTLVRTALIELNPALPDWLGFDLEIVDGTGRPPYKVKWTIADAGVSIFTNDILPHALIEVSGRGCAKLRVRGVETEVLRAVTPRLTRLDIASDILTETRPAAFAEHRQPGRFSAHSHLVSDSGETYYIGSRSSDRYCRVYRYNPPHERHQMLRIEYVLKAEQARYTALSVISDGPQAVSKTLGEVFGWQHACYEPDIGPAAEIVVWRPERHEGKTLYWLNNTIAPLIARLVNEEALDLDDWLTSQVRPRII